MLEGHHDAERRRAQRRASEICALTWGFRHKRPDLRKLYRSLTDFGEPFDRERWQELLDISNRRAAAARAAPDLNIGNPVPRGPSNGHSQ